MFTKGFQKTAGEATEVVGSILGFPLGTAVGAGIGALRKGYTKEELKDVDKRTISNILLPPLAAYRMTRRIKGERGASQKGK